MFAPGPQDVLHKMLEQRQAKRLPTSSQSFDAISTCWLAIISHRHGGAILSREGAFSMT